MKKLLTFIYIMLLSLSLFGQDTHPVGSKSNMTMQIPKVFLAEQESEDTVFIMPRKDDEDGPISLRLTSLRDLKEHELDEDDIKDLLKRFNKTDKVEKYGENLYSTIKKTGASPDGTKWICNHFAIYSDGFLITATIQTIEGREKETQCKELWDAVPDLLKSISRKAL